MIRSWVVLFLATATPHFANGAPPTYMANGVKIGEVTSTTAIVWTRLTKRPERHVTGRPFPRNANKQRRSLRFDDLDAMLDNATGAAGDVRLSFGEEGSEKTQSLDWMPVNLDGDFTHQFEIENLQPETRYVVKAEGRPSGGREATCTVHGRFATAPDAKTPARIEFAVATCTDYPRRDSPDGHKIYSQMEELDLNFFVHAGDIEYYDKPGPYADNQALARFKWNRIYSLPKQRSFHNVTASYFIKDDHDTLRNDAWPGQTYGDLTWEQGLAIFREQVPMREKTYRTVRWGKDLQIWMVEGRDFRSPNRVPDGPDKTIWGKEQKQWFFDTVTASDATFRILISPTPIVGPDRESKNDNHANAGFAHEGDEIRDFIGTQDNMLVICGDRHWQYVSEDPKTGVREFACGAGSDAHAGGFSMNQRTAMHRYLKIKGGFLGVTVERMDGNPRAVMTHYGVDGSVYNQEVLDAD